MPSFTKPLVFINYRRADARAESGRLASDLERAFGDGFVFQDVEDIHGGDKWIDALIHAGNQSKVILAIIGPTWLQQDENSKSRLDNPNDWVRKELESAIQQSKRIIPITVNEATIPQETDLPKSLKPLLHHQAFDIRTDRWKHDVQLLVKQLEKVTETKSISQDRLKKLMKFARLLGFLMVPLIAGLFLVNSRYNSAEDLVGQAPITEIPPPSYNSPNHVANEETLADKKHKFCPQFNQAADLKTLLFPFSNADGGDYSVEHIIQRKISKTCSKFGVQVDIGKPNTGDNEYFDLQQAKQKCADCIPDILLTGLSFKDATGNFGVQADFGFCDPLFDGFTLNEELMEIDVASIPISSLSSNPNIQASIDHVIQIYLGIYLSKKGDYNKSNTILKQTVEDKAVNKSLKKEAYKILWQNGYQLNDKEQCIQSLEKMYELDNNNLKAVATKSVILYDESKYSDAIKGFDILVNKTQIESKKEAYIVKRADAKYKNKQYAKAKADYLKVKRTNAINTKIIKTNQKIEANKKEISKLNSNIQNLTPIQKVSLAELYFQNGNAIQSQQLIQMVNINQINTNVTKISPELLNSIQTKGNN